MSGPLRSKLDANQVLRDSFDEVEGRLRVDASVTASIGTVDVIIDASSGDNLSIASKDGQNFLTVNPDGSIDTNTAIDAAGGDNVLILGTDDGTLAGTQNVLAIDHHGVASVRDSDSVNELQHLNDGLTAILTELEQKTEPGNAQNIRALSSGTDSVTATITSLPLPTGAATEATLQAVVDAVDNVSPLTAGTDDGTSTGTVFYNVNNIRQQILATDDRVEVATYTDLGLKTQRITEMLYSSSKFPGVSVKKEINWVFDGKFYAYSGSSWSVI